MANVLSVQIQQAISEASACRMASGCEVMKRRLTQSVPIIEVTHQRAWPHAVTGIFSFGILAADKFVMVPKMFLLRVILLALLSAVIPPLHAAPAEPRLLIRDGLILTMKDGEPTPFVGYVLVGSDGRISTVGRGSPPANLTAQSIVDASGKMVAPGFISGHSHIFATGMRGLGASLTIRAWIEAWVPYIAASSDEDLYYFTLHGCKSRSKSAAGSRV